MLMGLTATELWEEQTARENRTRLQKPTFVVLAGGSERRSYFTNRVDAKSNTKKDEGRHMA
jgi:hypothetical protein